MSNGQTITDRIEQGFTKGGKRYLEATSSPQESTVKAPVSTVSPVANDLFKKLHLPKVVADTLDQALKELGLGLKRTKSFDEIEDDWIYYHMIETKTGKIGLLYLDTEILQDAHYRKDVNSMGYAFMDVCKSLFFFSNAEAAENTYEVIFNVWVKKGKFEKVDLVLNSRIQKWLENAEKDIEIVVIKIRDKFGLSDEASADDLAGKERSFDTVKLSKLLDGSFNEKELKSLCFDLKKYDLDYDDLGGDAKDTKINELIGHFERRSYLHKLVEYCKEKRPSAAWDKAEN